MSRTLLLVLLPACAGDPTADPSDARPGDTGGTGGTPPAGCEPQAWPIRTDGHQQDRRNESGVVWWAPAAPRGLVLVFHADKKDVTTLFTPEHEETWNELAARDLAYLMVNAVGADWQHASGTDNADVQRIAAVRDELIGRGDVAADTPVFAMGFSGGAGFASTMANAALELGWDFRGFSAHNSGGFEVAPVDTIHVAHANDPTLSFDRADEIGADQADTGRRALVWKFDEIPLDPLRFTKIEEISADESRTWFDELVALGLVDAQGVRQFPLSEYDARMAAFESGSSLPGPNRASAQLNVIWRLHIWAADRACDEAEFFLQSLDG